MTFQAQGRLWKIKENSFLYVKEEFSENITATYGVF